MLELCKKIQKPSEKRIDGGYMEQEAELSTCASLKNREALPWMRIWQQSITSWSS